MMKKGIARSKGKKKFQKVIVDFLLVEAENRDSYSNGSIGIEQQ